MDFTHVIGNCTIYIEQLANQGYVDEDIEHYIFESAMEAVFGKDVWKFVNKSRK